MGLSVTEAPLFPVSYCIRHSFQNSLVSGDDIVDTSYGCKVRSEVQIIYAERLFFLFVECSKGVKTLASKS